MPGWQALDLDAEAAFVSSVLGDDEVVYMKIPLRLCLRAPSSCVDLFWAPLSYYYLLQLKKGGVAKAKGEGEKENECTTECKSRRRRDEKAPWALSYKSKAFRFVGCTLSNSVWCEG